MINALRVGYSVLRYRGGIGQWAWAINRVAGLGVLLFLALHIFDIFLAGFGPGLFNDLLFLYKGPAARILDVFLVFGLLYHGINGLRLTLMDFQPSMVPLSRQLFNIQIVIFLLLFIPAGTFLAAEFYGGIIGGLILTLVILAIPAVVAFGSSAFPFGTADVEVSAGNYRAAVIDLARSRGRPRSAFEFNAWLFMRISGLALIFLALFHMFWLHFVTGVENINFDTMVQRWIGPQGAFWRSYDLLLLGFAFTHGMNGARMVLNDYFHSPGWRSALKIVLVVLWAVLMGLGMYIIFTFVPGILPK